MAVATLAASTFIQELLYISKDIVWKDETRAQSNEVSSESLNVELYMTAMKGMLNFDTIISFNEEVLLTVGLSASLAAAASEDKINIPVRYRDQAVALQTQYIINHYEERNNYYRMLDGLPDTDDTDFIYNTKYPELSATDIPIHELPITDIYNLETVGYLDELLAENPTKRYLYHMGSRKVTPYSARIAERFGILYMNTSEFTKINQDFRDCYNVCRYALIRSMYVPEKRKENALYDNFMAMTVLFMTIQQMQANFLDADITRDFYDYESLKYVYDSYGVPFYASIPLEYHTRIVKNINILMRHKGSTRVFFELFDIFNFGDMNVFDFYIMKTHRFEDGKPVFVYNQDGSEDKQAMYELKFGQVQLYNNPPLELSDITNHVEYSSMTVMDPYWISDVDLLDKLYSSEFNYTESKYVGIQTIFDLMNIVYETCYFFKMLMDNRLSTQLISAYFSALNTNIDLFTLTIYVASLTCEKYGYAGNLSADLPYVAKVMGFNFKESLSKIQADIAANPYLSGDMELNSLLLNMNVNSLASITTTFSNIDSLRKLFITRRTEATSIEIFQAYTELEKTIMTSTYVKAVFTKSNGELASTFSDLLGDLNQDLYIRLNNVGAEIDSEIETVLVMMRQTITSLKYVEMSVSSDASVMIEHLFKLLEFFKSAKAELTGYEIGYTLSKRGESIIKLFAKIEEWTYTQYLDYDMFEFLTDDLWRYQDSPTIDDELLLSDLLTLKGFVYRIGLENESILFLIDKIHLIQEWYLTKHRFHMSLNDEVRRVTHLQKIKDGLQLKTRIDLLYEKISYEGNVHLINDWFESLTDAIVKCATKNKNNKSNLLFDDKLTLISETIVP